MLGSTNSSVKRLRALTRDMFIPAAEMERHVKELTGKNDRLLVVVGGSSVEAALKGRLSREMREESRDSLFGPNDPLSTFSAKIKMAYALRLIDNDTRRNADYIREIRNVFAHRVAPTNLSTPEVAAVCNLLLLGIREGDAAAKRSARRRFLLAVIATGRAVWGDEKLGLPRISAPLKG